MRTAQELAAMTYDQVVTAWHRYEVSLVEKDAWMLAFGVKWRRSKKPLPEAVALAEQVKALIPN